MVLKKLVYEKDCNLDIKRNLLSKGIDPFLAKIFASRDISNYTQTQNTLEFLLHFKYLKNIDKVCKRLSEAIILKQNIIIVGDYDVDGATSCAVMIKSFKLFGIETKFLVPDRLEGYGLSKFLVDKALSLEADLIITVDNGISSVESVDYANKLGIEVIVTDHHLPSKKVPNCLIINPNQEGCNFASKNISGVGVAFYVMLALRSELTRLNYFNDNNIPYPNLAVLLDLVALGTICDVVKLDHNNRILVANGLKKIRSGNMNLGIKALFEISGKDFRKAVVRDLGFLIGPRINASGRLEDISISIKCLLSSFYQEALIYANNLDKLNNTRRGIELSIIEEAISKVKDMDSASVTLSIYNSNWHQGLIGIVAGRLKDKFNKPVIVFTKDKDNTIKGSGRSIDKLHMKDVLDLINKKYPNLILKFGGHAMAAGLSINLENFIKFKKIFEKIVRELLKDEDLQRVYITDGILGESDINLENAIKLYNLVWGQGFDYPIFHDNFLVLKQWNVGANHKKLLLQKGNSIFDAMIFKMREQLPNKIFVVYKMIYNEWKANTKELQLYIDYWHSL